MGSVDGLKKTWMAVSGVDAIERLDDDCGCSMVRNWKQGRWF